MKGFGLGIHKKLCKISWLFVGKPVIDGDTHDANNYWTTFHAGTTDNLLPTPENKHQVIAFYIEKQLKDSTVLDLGCGFGRMNIFYNIKEYYGLDTNERMLSNAEDLNFKNQKTNYKFYLGDGKTLPFPNEKFDFVISSQVLLHLHIKTVESYAKEVYRILKPNGSFVASIPKRRLLDVEKTFKQFRIELLDSNYLETDEVYKFTKVVQ